MFMDLVLPLGLSGQSGVGGGTPSLREGLPHLWASRHRVLGWPGWSPISTGLPISSFITS